ncbi:MAG: cation:proton antiporter [Flavobacteriales bacterium]|nr:cation:proton antiporter [Flavobacteriales bacterium]
MHVALFEELLVVLALGVGIILLFRRLRLPGVLGFILAGAIAGPHGLGWVDEVETVETLAELGIIFLLFVIGMEFSLKKLASLGTTVFVGGSLQAGLTIGIVAWVAHLMGLAWPAAIFMGFLIALSSTAIVLRVLKDQGRIDAPHGRVSAAILIYQDILVVPMLLVVPLLAGQSRNVRGDLLVLLGKMVVLVVAVYMLGRFVVPRLLHTVSRGRNQELFLTTVVALCFGAAWATQAMGLSLALGAFFAGILISETDQAYHASGLVKPFHELFMSFFFVSIGMLVEPGLFATRPLAVFGLAILVMLLKTITAFVAVWVLRYPVRTALMSALALLQVGEFAFVLALPGMRLRLLSPENYQLFLGVSILSMAATPFLMNRSEFLVRRLFTTFLPRAVGERLDAVMRVRRESRSAAQEMRDHIVIVGFGLNGQNVAKAAASARIRCAVIEADPTQARIAAEMGLHVVHGDAQNEHVLEMAHVSAARVVVVAISDADTTRRIVRSLRAHSTAYLIVRTRYVREIAANIEAGANEVIPEEFETSIEIFYRVLRKYLVPEHAIKDLVARIRRDHYGMLRGTPTPGKPSARKPAQDEVITIPGLEIATLPVSLGRSRVVGRSIAEVGLREKYGITVLAIRRGKRYITNLSGAERIQQDDLLYLLGAPDNIERLDRELR